MRAKRYRFQKLELEIKSKVRRNERKSQEDVSAERWEELNERERGRGREVCVCIAEF